MVPQNNFTTQLNEPEDITEYFQDYEDATTNENNEDRENSRASTVTSLISGSISVAFDVSQYWAEKICHAVLPSRILNSSYENRLRAASNYEEWADAAKELDRLEGKDGWKNDPKSPDYDYELLHRRWSQLKIARNNGDLSQMTYLLRTSLARNLGDMGQPKLYSHTRIGTKILIDSYINEVVKQMNIICDDTESESTKDKLDFFTNTRQSFGRTALLLSGGATFGLIHFGVIKSLYECKLLPRIISGASSGSIIAALICTKTDEEIPSTLGSLDSDEFSLDVFQRSTEPDTWKERFQRLLSEGVLFDIDILRECMRRNIPDLTFQEAYNRTRRILNITVSSSTVYEMPRLLNYLTAPNVLIWSAVAVSCCVPLVYSSAPLMAKDKSGKEVPWNPSGHRWIDGSVENDLPMNKLSELFNVNHFIVCQVNPHVVPFIQEKSIIPSPVSRLAGGFLFLAISELQHRMSQLSDLGIAQNLFYKVQSIMSQRYYGDITIVPDISYSDFLRILSNPTPKSIREAILKGEKATWSKISIIRNHCQIELTLDEIVHRLRLRHFEETIADNSGHNDSVKSNRRRPQMRPFKSTNIIPTN